MAIFILQVEAAFINAPLLPCSWFPRRDRDCRRSSWFGPPHDPSFLEHTLDLRPRNRQPVFVARRVDGGMLEETAVLFALAVSHRNVCLVSSS